MKTLIALFTLASALHAAPTADEIVARMMENDAKRLAAQGPYQGMRKYSLVNKSRHATMLVRVNGSADGTKQFSIIDEAGSSAVRSHVFHKMLNEEAAASQPDIRERARISPTNYTFQFAGTETVNGRAAYILEATPRKETKYLIVGKVWVDQQDFALVRVQGRPAKTPSFWTKSVQFTHAYQKSGAFWFPVSNSSITDARIFGRADLVIEYFDYAPASMTAGIRQ